LKNKFFINLHTEVLIGSRGLVTLVSLRVSVDDSESLMDNRSLLSNNDLSHFLISSAFNFEGLILLLDVGEVGSIELPDLPPLVTDSL